MADCVSRFKEITRQWLITKQDSVDIVNTSGLSDRYLVGHTGSRLLLQKRSQGGFDQRERSQSHPRIYLISLFDEY